MSTQKQGLFAFYENLARDQHDLDYYLNPVGLSRRNIITALLDAQPNDVIGDLGCGEGLIALKLQGRVIGSDLSPARARLARANGITALSADVVNLPHPDACFDKIVCSEVIEHLVEPAAALREIYRVLRHGGIAVLTVPLGERLGQTLLNVPQDVLGSGRYTEIKEQFNLKNSHLSAFTEDSFQDLLRQCHFEIKAISFTYNYIPKRRLLLRFFKRAYRLLAQRSPIALLSGLVERVICASYQEQADKHHIIVEAQKPLLAH